MDSSYLGKRAKEMGLDRQGILVEVQAWLEVEYPGRCRALSLNGGVLKLTTPDSSVASELRLRQTELLAAFSQASRVVIQISTII